MFFSKLRAPEYARRALWMIMVFCMGMSLAPGQASAAPSFPDNLKALYSADDFRMRSAAATGDIRFIEKQLAAKKSIDGRLALLEFYRRCDLPLDMRRTALELRTLLHKEPTRAWNTGRLWNILAKSHEYLGEWSEALRAYRRSLHFEDTAAIRERIMEMELALGHIEASEDACRAWLDARTRSDTHSSTGRGHSEVNENLRRRELARLFERLGMKNVAAETYARAAEAMPLEPATLYGYLRCETSALRRVNVCARILERDGYKLNTVAQTVELFISQGRAPEASRLLDRMASFFTMKKSPYWALLVARAYTAAGEWEKAAGAFRQARLWRPNAPEEERAYFLTHEADLLARLGRTSAVEALLCELQNPVWEEAVFFVRLRLLRAMETEAGTNMIAVYASAPDGSWKNLSTDFMAKLSDRLPHPSDYAFMEKLWDRVLGKERDPIAVYEAGRYYLGAGRPDKAYPLFMEARMGMRGFGGLLPYLSITADRLGRAKEAEEYRSQGCYLFGRASWLERCAAILARI